jgi:4-hydroxybenzoate polyprenyltransferase
MIKNYLSLIKFSHTVFALPFALIGVFLGITDWQAGGKSIPVHLWSLVNQLQQNETAYMVKTIVLVVLCMVFGRSAAMAFNRYADRKIDEKNPRTVVREIPAGIIQAKSALLFTIFMSVLFVFTTYLINTLCFALSPVALSVVLGYSFTKRFTALCHFVLGLGLSLAPIGAYLAVTAQFSLIPLLFSFLVLFWVSGFDIIYALQDDEFDKGEGLHSIPASVGRKNALLFSRFLHFCVILILTTILLIGELGIWYKIGAFIFSGLLFYQHILVKPNDLRKVNLAFFTSNGIASVVFAIFVITDILT